MVAFKRHVYILTSWTCVRESLLHNSGSSAHCTGKAKTLRHWCFFDLDKARGQESKISQIHLSQKANRMSVDAARGFVWEGVFQGTEREVCVSWGINDAYMYQTPGRQQLLTANLKTFFPSTKQTHKFSVWPWRYLLLLDKETPY